MTHTRHQQGNPRTMFTEGRGVIFVNILCSRQSLLYYYHNINACEKRVILMKISLVKKLRKLFTEAEFTKGSV